MSETTIKLTDKATAEILRIMSNQKIAPDTHYLRFGIRGGGCSGFEYILGFDNSASEEDEIVEESGIRIAIEKKALTFTEGTEIDFEETLMERHFVFTNPNATRTCGCGTSFSV